MVMRIVRKLSRKRYYGKVCYEYERFFIPIPAKGREIIHHWVDSDLKVQVEPFSLGFAVLVYLKDRLLGLYRLSNRFEWLLQQLEKETNIRPG